MKKWVLVLTALLAMPAFLSAVDLEEMSERIQKSHVLRLDRYMQEYPAYSEQIRAVKETYLELQICSRWSGFDANEPEEETRAYFRPLNFAVDGLNDAYKELKRADSSLAKEIAPLLNGYYVNEDCGKLWSFSELNDLAKVWLYFRGHAKAELDPIDEDLLQIPAEEVL